MTDSEINKSGYRIFQAKFLPQIVRIVRQIPRADFQGDGGRFSGSVT
jgi:hypothetical protein